MTSILVVCGAGASSTFLASRIRKLAAERGLPITARAASASELSASLDGAAVILVGPHLEAEFEAISSIAAAQSIPTALLPATAFGADGAIAALDTAVSLINDPHDSQNLTNPRPADKGPLHA